ncbi:splicing regulator SDE2 [Amia ocellicauda]|uniref:splicing regulator SDE2 n=1 Tax=Amia ocellicauda TaxID=2972642 RepID=UPI003464ADD2
MEVLVRDLCLHTSSFCLSPGASVGDLIRVFSEKKGIPVTDFYVKSNGRLAGQDEGLQAGVVYRLEPRLCGGKGGFGSMLRALGAQIEKTTNREACRDLSGRRLRDVNHEKEMADWLKKQAEREAEKEQRRLERLKRKLAEPKHYFTDPNYEQQCHELSERLEDSVLKGMQASSSGMVVAEEGPSRKRPTRSAEQKSKDKKKCFWTGVDGLEEMSSSEEDSNTSEEEDSDSPSGVSSGELGCPAQRARAPARAEAQGSPGTSSSASSGPGSPQRSAVEQQQQEVAAVAAVPMPVVQTETTQTHTPEGTKTGTKPCTETEQAPAEEAKETSPANAADTQRACSPVQPVAEGPLDLLAFHSVAELEGLGLDRLKAELMGLGLKCGGTLQERAARLFSVRGRTKDQIDPVLFAKSTKGKKK